MCGIGVISFITVIFSPVDPRALIADSLPFPGPFITTSTCFMPCSIAFFPASSAASCAAKGVDFRDPLNPLLPEDDQEIVLPVVSVIKSRVDVSNAGWNIFFCFLFRFCSFGYHLNYTAFFFPAIGIALPFLVRAFVCVL